MKKILVSFCILFLMLTGMVSSSPSPRDVFSQGKYYEAMYRDFPVGIAFVDRNGRFLYVNALLCTFLGRNEEELKRLTWQDVTASQDVDVDEAASQKVISGEDRTYTLFKQYVHKRGDTIWARLTVVGLRNTDGSFDHFVSIVEPLASSISFEAEISSRLKEILKVLSEVESGRQTSFASFLSNNWSTVIPWLVISIISIGGVIFRVQTDSKDIKQLREENKELRASVDKTQEKVNEIANRKS